MKSRPLIPNVDPELAAALEVALDGGPSPITIDDLPQKREADLRSGRDARRALEARGVGVQEFEVVSSDGETLQLDLLSGPSRSSTSPLIYYVHGGGMMLGNRWTGIDVVEDWIFRFNAVVATIEYRLAPEAQFPLPQEDCYAALCWLSDHQGELGLNVGAGLIVGTSAGAGLAASVALMARERGGPKLAGMMLIAPMLDDRAETESARQYAQGMWSVEENRLGWDLLLGNALQDAEALPEWAVPGRCENLADLPHAFMEVGSADLFRDDTIAFADRIWRADGRAELHVWSGGFHGFEVLSHTLIAQAAIHARNSWIQRVLGVPDNPPTG
jgi:acetyl esterase/lipase